MKAFRMQAWVGVCKIITHLTPSSLIFHSWLRVTSQLISSKNPPSFTLTKQSLWNFCILKARPFFKRKCCSSLIEDNFVDRSDRESVVYFVALNFERYFLDPLNNAFYPILIFYLQRLTATNAHLSNKIYVSLYFPYSKQQIVSKIN